MGSTMVQLNTRIPVDLKEQGDRALERAGYTSSQAVRALWEFAARHAHEPGAVHTLLEEDEAGKETKSTQSRLSAYEKGTHIIERAYEALGLNPHETYGFRHASYKELRDQYYDERLEQGE